MQQPRRKGEKVSILVESCTRTLQGGKIACSCLYRAYKAKFSDYSTIQVPTSSYKIQNLGYVPHINKFCVAVPSTQELLALRANHLYMYTHPDACTCSWMHYCSLTELAIFDILLAVVEAGFRSHTYHDIMKNLYVLEVFPRPGSQ